MIQGKEGRRLQNINKGLKILESLGGVSLKKRALATAHMPDRSGLEHAIATTPDAWRSSHTFKETALLFCFVFDCLQMNLAS